MQTHRERKNEREQFSWHPSRAEKTRKIKFGRLTFMYVRGILNNNRNTDERRDTDEMYFNAQANSSCGNGT